jgi:glycosyltransferase involved in cell wall biosynthesis
MGGPGVERPKTAKLYHFFRVQSSVKAAIIIRRIGPYHAARLTALEQLFRGQLSVIEIAATDESYAWDTVHELGSLMRLTLFSSEAEAGVAPLWKGISETLSALQPDVVAIPGWGDPGALAALAWSQEHRAATILMSDSTECAAPRTWWREQIKSSIVKAADAALVAGKPHQRYIVNLGMNAARIVTGYDVVDNAHFIKGADSARARSTAFRNEFGLPKRFILSVCRFIQQKNILQLLDAHALALRLNPSKMLPLVLVGSGPLEQAIRARAAEADVAGHVFIKPFAQYEMLPFLYGLADGFVLASISETWGLVINEAMASGLPVLASSLCGAAEDLIIDGQTGFLADPHNVSSLADSLVRLSTLSNGQRWAMAQAARAHISTWGLERFAAAFFRSATIALTHRKLCRRPSFARTVYLRAVAGRLLRERW